MKNLQDILYRQNIQFLVDCHPNHRVQPLFSDVCISKKLLMPICLFYILINDVSDAWTVAIYWLSY